MKGWLAELEAASSAGRGERGERFSLQPCLGRYLLHQRVQNSKGRLRAFGKSFFGLSCLVILGVAISHALLVLLWF